MNNPWYYKIDNILIKKRKPCLPQDRVHISIRDGVYTVSEVRLSYFIVKTKSGKWYRCSWDQFICKYGEGAGIYSELARTKNNLQNIINNAENALTEIRNIKNYVRYRR